MIKRWVRKPEADPEIADRLAGQLNIGSVLASLLVQRGIHTFEQARQYFRPKLEDLHDPFLMEDMDKAVDRLQQALDANERILIYGDYDVDGTTAVALAYGFLSQQHDNIEYYVPDRYKEGYGISEAGIQHAIDQGVGLIISLDCGIKAVNMVAKAAEAGIDFIVCDHHLPGSQLPPAKAILDPKRKECAYPYKELSGAGIGFKFMQALCIRQERDLKGLYQYLDLTVVSIAADIVPITGENRILAYWGLQKLNKRPRAGLSALIEQADFKREIDISNIVFGIGPRINASGRIAHAKAAVHLLLTDTLEEARELAEAINEKNSLRRNFDTTITQEALKMIEQQPNCDEAKATVLFKPDWHKGVIGIVASRCLDAYYRPTIILTQSEGKATGSARSVMGFDIYEAISACSDLLEQYGGHMYAAGLTLPVDKVEEFQRRFEATVAERISPELLIPQLEIDQEISFNDITPAFFRVLRQMGPFGPENMTPMFISRGIRCVGRPRVLKEKHLKMTLMQEGSDVTFDAIGFDMGEYFSMIGSGMRISIAYNIEENTYWGPGTLELYLRDIKFE